MDRCWVVGFAALFLAGAVHAADPAAALPAAPKLGDLQGGGPQASPKVADVQVAMGEAKRNDSVGQTLDDGQVVKTVAPPVFLHQGSLELKVPSCAAEFIASNGACRQ